MQALGENGLPIKAIAEVTGVARNTVRGDLVGDHVYPARVRLEDGTEITRNRDSSTRTRYPDGAGFTTKADGTITSETDAQVRPEIDEEWTRVEQPLRDLLSRRRDLSASERAWTTRTLRNLASWVEQDGAATWNKRPKFLTHSGKCFGTNTSRASGRSRPM